MEVGNQLPILLISFGKMFIDPTGGWESVTNPLDKLSVIDWSAGQELGISYQSS